MTREREGHICRALTSALSTRLIRRLAEEHDVVKRRRKIDIVSLVRALVLGFAAGRRRTLDSLRRAYELLSGQTLARSSFHKRLNSSLELLMKGLVEHHFEKTEAAPGFGGSLAAFREVLAIDSCVVRLHPTLSAKLPGTRHPASAKLTMVTNVGSRNPLRLKLSPGRCSDVHLMNYDVCRPDRLLIFDLGFYSSRVFSRIDQRSGLFLTRARTNINPKIEAAEESGQAWMVGQRLKGILSSYRGDRFDVTTTLEVSLPDYSKYPLRMRIIGVRNKKTGQWHRYVTNAPASQLSSEAVTSLYAARWEVELLFRELQSDHRLGDVSTSKQQGAMILLYSAVLSMIVSRRLHQVLRAKMRASDADSPRERWSRLFHQHAVALLSLLAAPSRKLDQILTHVLCREMLDPNRSRPHLLARVQHGSAGLA